MPGDPTYDLVVIGGGINGAGIARDAALRGLSTLLVEAGDFGSGTSSWSSRLIHGGLRYLEYGELGLVYESLHERRRLLEMAPHLVRPLRLVIPLYRGGRRAPWIVRAGMLAYDLLSIGKSLPRHRMLSRREALARLPALRADGLAGAATYFDAQVTYAERLVLENLLDAAAAGAELKNYCRVTGFAAGRDGHRVTWRDEIGGEESEAQCRVLINAAGPWVDRVLGLGERTRPRLMGGTKGAHVVTGGFPGAPADACYVEAADGRPVFIIPWNGQYLVGTTDTRYDGDPADARATRADVDYLLATVNAVFPGAGLGHDAVHYAYAGVRPLPYVARGPESAITRRHILHEHDARGLLSVVGGKLTTFRSLAAQATDRACALLGRAGLRGDTGRRPLPGGGAARLPAGFAGLEDAGRERLESLYGSRVDRLVALCTESPALERVIDTTHGVLAAEVALAVREEYARTLVDLVHRRLMVGLAADRGASAAPAVAGIAAEEFGWDDAERDRQLAALADYGRRLEPAHAD